MAAAQLDPNALNPENSTHRQKIISMVLGPTGALRPDSSLIGAHLVTALNAVKGDPELPYVETSELSPGRGILTVAMSDFNFIKRTIARTLRELGIFASDDPDGVLVRGKAILLRGLGHVALSLYEGILPAQLQEEATKLLLHERLSALPRINQDLPQMRLLTQQTLDSTFQDDKSLVHYLMRIVGERADGYLWGLQRHQLDSASNVQDPLASAEHLGLFAVKNEQTRLIHEHAHKDIEDLRNSEAKFLIRRIPEPLPIHDRRLPLHVCYKTAGGQIVSLLCNESTPLKRGSALSLPLVGNLLENAALVAARNVALSDDPATEDRETLRRCHDALRNIPSDFAVTHQDKLVEIASSAYAGHTAAVLLGLDEPRRIATIFVNFPTAVINRQYSDQLFRDVSDTLETMLGAKPRSSTNQIADGTEGSMGVYFSIPCSLSPQDLQEKWEKHQDAVLDFARSWEDKARLLATLPDGNDEHFRQAWTILNNAPRNYKQNVTPAQAIVDAKQVACLDSTDWVRVALDPATDTNGVRSISIYSLNKELLLDDSHRVLKSLGLTFKDESSQELVSKEGPVHIYRYSFPPPIDLKVDDKHFNTVVSRAIEQMLQNRADVDLHNALLLSAELDLRQVRMLGGYCDLLAGRRSLLDQASPLSRDVKSFFSVLSAVIAHPELARLIVEGFEAKFAPVESSKDASVAARLQRFDQLHDRFEQLLYGTKNMPGDHASVLKALWDLVDKSDWSNYISGKDTIAVRVNSSEVEFFSKPRPKYLKIISHPDGQYVGQMWGDNARGGDRHVANKMDRFPVVDGLSRGQAKNFLGIGKDGRKGVWSFRDEPAREDRPARLATALTEVHDASAAIQLNYSVHRQPTSGRIYWTKEVLADSVCLRDYGHGEEWSPSDRIHADGIGPDVNTGEPEIIDRVNRMAYARGHWRGLSYMTSGSRNISHDRYYATTGGVEQKLRRYTRDLGLVGQPLLVNGAIDGRGELGHNALISETFGPLIQLQVSVNQNWVFVNPDPSSAAIAEQQRLGRERLDLDSFDRSLLSPGGGLYHRDQLNHLSGEQKQLIFGHLTQSQIQLIFGEGFDQSADLASGVDIAKAAFLLPCDVVYPTGVTTVIIAPDENPASVSGLPADGFYVRADLLANTAKMVVEGANLYLTPKARKFLQEAGVLCCTDSDDNSFGVTASHIDTYYGTLFYMVGELEPGSNIADLQTNFFAKHARELLTYFQERHNGRRALLYSLEGSRSNDDLDYVEAFLNIESNLVQTIGPRHLPTPEEFERKHRLGKGLLNAELSDLMMATKKWLIENIHESGLPIREWEHFRPYYMRYVKDEIYQSYPEYVDNHIERYELAVAEAVNEFVDTLGPAFFYRTAENHSTHPSSVIKCAIAARKILGTEQTREFLESLDGKIPDADFKALMHTLNDAERTFTDWLVALYGRPERNRAERPISEIVEKFSARISELNSNGADIFPQNTAGATRFLEDYTTILGRLAGVDQIAPLISPTVPVENIATQLALLNQVEKLAECMHSARKSAQQLALSGGSAAMITEGDFMRVGEKLEEVLGLQKIGGKHEFLLDQISEHVLFHTSLSHIRHSLWGLARRLVDEDPNLVKLNERELYEAIQHKIKGNKYFSDLQKDLAHLEADRAKAVNDSSGSGKSVIRASRAHAISEVVAALVGPIAA